MEIKKRRLVIWIIILFLVLVSIFYFLWNYKTPEDKWEDMEYARPEDYVIEGNMVKNPKYGLSFEIPEGWRVEKNYNDFIAFYSPDAEGTFIMKKGCQIISEIREIKTDIETIEKRSRKMHEGWDSIDEYGRVKISGYEALRNITGTAQQHYIIIDIPIQKGLKGIFYTFGVASNVNDKEKCSQVFENFLKSITIE
jgi:hypothetical protein